MEKFPKPIVQIVEKFRLTEMHLTFTQGRWLYEHWGLPIYNGPSGVELYARFDYQNQTDRTFDDEKQQT